MRRENGNARIVKELLFVAAAAGNVLAGLLDFWDAQLIWLSIAIIVFIGGLVILGRDRPPVILRLLTLVREFLVQKLQPVRLGRTRFFLEGIFVFVAFVGGIVLGMVIADTLPGENGGASEDLFPPRLTKVEAIPNPVAQSGQFVVVADAVDPDSTSLCYRLRADFELPSGCQARAIPARAPADPRQYTITVEVSDGKHEDEGFVILTVVEAHR